MNALDLPNRVFSTEFAKVFCRKTYGHRINKTTWCNWRSWADIPLRRRSCTYEQLCFLVAIAQVRGEDRDLGKGFYPELSCSRVKVLADDPSFQERIVSGVRFIDDSAIVMGRDAPRALRLNGVEASLRSLYRNVPNFSAQKMYQLSDLKGKAIA